MILPLIFLAVFNLLDLWTTEALITIYGDDVEANPISAWLIEVDWLVETKVVLLVAVAAYCIWAVMVKSPRMDKIKRNLWILACIYLAVVISNVGNLTHTINTYL